MTISQILLNPIIVSAGTLLVTKVPSLIVSALSSNKKTKYSHKKEAFEKVYLPLYTEIFRNNFFNEISTDRMKAFINMAYDLFLDNTVLVPDVLLWKICRIKLKLDGNYPTSELRKIKSNFVEFKNLILRLYFKNRRSFLYSDISFSEIFNAMSPIHTTIVILYFIAIIAFGIDGFLLSFESKFNAFPIYSAGGSLLFAAILLIITKRRNL